MGPLAHAPAARTGQPEAHDAQVSQAPEMTAVLVINGPAYRSGLLPRRSIGAEVTVSKALTIALDLAGIRQDEGNNQ